MLQVYQHVFENNFLRSHLHFFFGKYEPMSDEHGERFNQEVAVTGKRYQGKCNIHKMKHTSSY